MLQEQNTTTDDCNLLFVTMNSRPHQIGKNSIGTIMNLVQNRTQKIRVLPGSAHRHSLHDLHTMSYC